MLHFFFVLDVFVSFNYPVDHLYDNGRGYENQPSLLILGMPIG